MAMSEAAQRRVIQERVASEVERLRGDPEFARSVGEAAAPGLGDTVGKTLPGLVERKVRERAAAAGLGQMNLDEKSRRVGRWLLFGAGLGVGIYALVRLIDAVLPPRPARPRRRDATGTAALGVGVAALAGILGAVLRGRKPGDGGAP